MEAEKTKQTLQAEIDAARQRYLAQGARVVRLPPEKSAPVFGVKSPDGRRKIIG